MGVKGFTKWLRTSYPLAFTRVPRPVTVDDFYVEINPILHCISRSANNPRQVFSRSKRTLMDIFKIVKPTHSTYFALDGPASLSKLREQRMRRIELMRRSLMKGTFDAQHFSPGCTFMYDFSTFLSSFASANLCKQTRVGISNASISGEGEHKIIDQIRKELRVTGRFTKNQVNLNSVKAIMASDSDTFIYGIGHEIRNGLIIDPVWENKSVAIQQFSINTFIELTEGKCREVVLLALFTGNDYIPGLRYSTFPSLWDTFWKVRNEVKLYDEKSGNINWSVMKDLLREKSRNIFTQNTKQFKEVPRMDPSQTAQYMKAVQILFKYSCGFVNEGILADFQLDYPFSAAPSIFDILEFEEGKFGPINDESTAVADTRRVIYPGSAAAMILTLDDTSIKYTPDCLHPILKEFKSIKFDTDLGALHWIQGRLDDLGRSNKVDYKSRRIIYPQTCEQWL